MDDTIKKILIVDDNKTYSRLISIVLSKRDYLVKVAESVSTAYKFLAKEEFDLIISDLVMPYIDGVDFLRVLKENETTKNIPVIIMSSYDTEDYNENLKNLGAFAVLPKSCKEGNLFPVIEEALGT
jgi:two-component system, chemotaxis family, chemotaxis protein CheY